MEELSQQVNDLLQSRRYDPDILIDLERYVEAQCLEGAYDGDANLACLKLYQFYPEKTNFSIVSKILLKALAALPSSDFISCLYLLGEKTQREVPVATVISWADALESGNFVDFWNSLQNNKDIIKGLPGIEDSFREFMLAVISRTYFRIHLSVLQKLLCLSQDDLIRFLNKHGMTNITNVILQFPSTEENQPRPKTIGEQLPLRKVLESLSNYSIHS
ncbi:Eukaryotic translation initiation factor 3 subunit K [Galdieria sulphuraria]|nr:Eukaryotic translation initiation factor 3 subunit K [Galdieria sulphuraria]